MCDSSDDDNETARDSEDQFLREAVVSALCGFDSIFIFLIFFFSKETNGKQKKIVIIQQLILSLTIA
jgi:hypothetical protein